MKSATYVPEVLNLSWQAMSQAGNPYGDGQAVARIVQTLLAWREATQ